MIVDGALAPVASVNSLPHYLVVTICFFGLLLIWQKAISSIGNFSFYQSRFFDFLFNLAVVLK